MLLIKTCYYSENQGFGGVSTRDMSLIETCFCSRLYDIYIFDSSHFMMTFGAPKCKGSSSLWKSYNILEQSKIFFLRKYWPFAIEKSSLLQTQLVWYTSSTHKYLDRIVWPQKERKVRKWWSWKRLCVTFQNGLR